MDSENKRLEKNLSLNYVQKTLYIQKNDKAFRKTYLGLIYNYQIPGDCAQ